MTLPYQNLNSTRWQQYQDDLSPTQLQQPVGSAIEMALAVQKDYEVDRLRYGIKAKLPGLAPADALAFLGIERGLPQGVSESAAAYAARLRDAWNAWQFAGTARGLLQVFAATGYSNVVIAQVVGGNQFTLDNGGTNSLLWSTDLTNTAWTKRGTCTVTKNSAVAPDGTTTAALVAGVGAVGVNDIFQFGSGGTNGTVYTPSFYLKRVSASGTLELHNPNGAGGSCIINLATIGAGWIRVDPGTLVTGVTTPGAFSVTSLNSGMHLYCTAGAPVSFNIWMPQSEIGVSAARAVTPTYGVAKSTTLGSGTLLTSSNGTWCPTWTTDPFWSRFDVIFPLPLMPPSWGWSSGIPSSSSSESNFIRALIQAWKPAHSTCNRIGIVTQGNIWGYPASLVWGAATGIWGGSSATFWTP